MRTIRRVGISLACGLLAVPLAAGCSQRGSDTGGTEASGACKGQQTTGITKTSIKLGGTYPLSGPASAYGEIPKGIRAYFDYVNKEKGGVGGRQIQWIVRDDGYQPPKAIEEARRLVEQEKVFALFQTLGTPSSTAIWDYANQQKVPQVYVATGASKWGADTRHPWTIGWQPSYVAESRIYAKWLKDTKPHATVAVLYQNDDYGQDYLNGFTKAIAGSGVKIVAKQSYEVTDPSVAPQMSKLAESKAQVFFNVTTPKFGSQALAADAKDTSWNPLHILNNVSASTTVLKPVGFDHVQGIVSAQYFKDPADPQWDDDPGMKLYERKLKQYQPGADPDDQFHAFGWAVAESLVKTLQSMKCPTREGLRDAMRAQHEQSDDMLLPGIRVNTGPGDGFPIESMRLMRFTGSRWHLFGNVVDTRKEFGPVS